MKWNIVVGVVVALPCTCVADDAELVKKELEKLQGKWQMVAATQNGKEIEPEEFKKANPFIVVRGEKYTPTIEGKTEESIAFKIDPSKKPRWVTDDLEYKYGIYELDGDTLRVCFAKEEKQRPTEFISKVGSKQNLYVFKRTKS